MGDIDDAERRYDLEQAILRAAEADHEFHDGAFKKSTLTERYREAMDAMFAMGGIAKEDVCLKAKRAVEKKIWSIYHRGKGVALGEVRIPHALWYRVAQEAGYTDPTRGRRSERPPQAEGKDTLPAQAARASRREGPDYSTENRRYISSVMGVSDSLRVVAEWMQRYPVDKHVTAEFREMLVALCDAFVTNVHDLANRRQVVPTNAQPMFVKICSTTIGMEPALREFFVRLVKIPGLIAKVEGGKRPLHAQEVTKYVEMLPRNLHVTFEPTGEEHAAWMGFCGQKCPVPECGSWRVIATPGNMGTVSCLRCRTQSPRSLVVFCRQCFRRLEGKSLEKCRADGKCPRCSFPMAVPEVVK